MPDVRLPCACVLCVQVVESGAPQALLQDPASRYAALHAAARHR